MANFFEDSINFGFGLFAYSREKLEALVEKMVETGKVERQDARGVMNDLVKKGEEQREEVRGMIKKEVASAVDTLGLKGDTITKDDVRAIIREELAATGKG
jgi:polyhydroxyalkanoate synthesis regulator phasin